jgi:hypothetical protein
MNTLLRGGLGLLAGAAVLLLWFLIFDAMDARWLLGGITTHGGPPYTVTSLLFDFVKATGGFLFAGATINVVASWKPPLLAGGFAVVMAVAALSQGLNEWYPVWFQLSVLASWLPLALIGAFSSGHLLQALK